MFRRRVLVVDDDQAIRETMALVLSEEGFPVATACHGRAALDWLRAHIDEPSLVLLDLMMPVMDGRSFLLAKAADPLLAPVPVVVVSAGRDLDCLLQAPGVRACLPKPITIERLLRAVTDWATR